MQKELLMGFVHYDAMGQFQNLTDSLGFLKNPGFLLVGPLSQMLISIALSLFGWIYGILDRCSFTIHLIIHLMVFLFNESNEMKRAFVLYVSDG